MEPVNCTNSELSIYLQELAEGYLPMSCSDTSVCAPSKSITIASKSWQHGRRTGLFHGFQFSMTCELSMEDLGEDSSMSLRGASLARTSVLRAEGQGSMANEADSGRTWQGLLAKYDPESRSWRTAQSSLLEDSEEFLETWTRSGTTRSGMSYLRPTLVLPICESASGFWQTPVADDAIERTVGKWNSRGEPKLSAEVKLWPTLTVSGNYNRKGASKSSGDGLATAVRMWPTPCASASKGSSPAALVRKSGRSRANDRIDHAIMASDGGQLNPNFVEWLMGWTYEHTALDQRRIPFPREEITEDCLRIMWNDAGFTSSPQGQRFIEQLSDKYPDLVRELSHGTALGRGQKSVAALSAVLLGLWEACYSWPLRNTQESFQEAWQRTPCEEKGWVAMASVRGIWHAEWPGIPRISIGINHRVHRIRALGNGQVSRVAASAFVLLSR